MRRCLFLDRDGVINAALERDGKPYPPLASADFRIFPEVPAACARLKAAPSTARIPILFLTAKTRAEDEVRGFQAGGVDYIAKPFNPVTLLARVATHLELSQSRRLLEHRNLFLERLVTERTADISAMQDATILAMASLAETRDNETGNHLRRTQQFVKLLACALNDHPRFEGKLSDIDTELLFKSAPLHDIGKVAIPDRILLKPGKLDTDEFEIMKRHAEYGRDVIHAVERHLGSSNSFLRYAREIAYSHHEKATRRDWRAMRSRYRRALWPSRTFMTR